MPENLLYAHSVTETLHVCAAKSSTEESAASPFVLFDSHLSHVVGFSPLQHLVSAQGQTHLGQERVMQHVWHRERCLVCGRSWKARRNPVGDLRRAKDGGSVSWLRYSKALRRTGLSPWRQTICETLDK